MFTMKRSSLYLLAGFVLCLAGLIYYAEDLLLAHIYGAIDYVAADARTYHNLYVAVFADLDLREFPTMMLVGSPIVLLAVAHGSLLAVQIWQLVLMALALRAGAACFSTLRGQMAFIVWALLFPYFFVGFLSINKEIYAMCSAIFYACYMLRGYKRHLWFSLFLAMCARYYMFMALLALLVLVPRNAPPRYRLMLLMMVAISVLAPIAKMLVPGYSAEGVLDDPSVSSLLFAKIINSFGYILAYPLKYVFLIPIRAYSFLLDPSRVANRLEGLVSLFSIVIVMLPAYLISFKKPLSARVKMLFLMAVVAPMPIMWTEIMHWRYFSFVYYFFLMGLVTHFVEEPRVRLLAASEGVHA